MESSNGRETEKVNVPRKGGNRRFYPPGVLAAYAVLFLPVGLYLYGLNVIRRGNRLPGCILAGISGVAFLGMLVVAASGASVFTYGILGIFIGIGLFRMESGPYRRAISRGGVAARWWPPLLWVAGSVILVVIVSLVMNPD